MNIHQFLEKTGINIPEDLILKTFPDMDVILCKYAFSLERQLIKHNTVIPIKVKQQLRTNDQIPVYLWGVRTNKYNEIVNQYHGIFISKGFITVQKNNIFTLIHKRITTKIGDALETPMGKETIMQDLYIKHILTYMPEYKIT